jgi:hypothetical protein
MIFRSLYESSMGGIDPLRFQKMTLDQILSMYLSKEAIRRKSTPHAPVRANSPSPDIYVPPGMSYSEYLVMQKREREASVRKRDKKQRRRDRVEELKRMKDRGEL